MSREAVKLKASIRKDTRLLFLTLILFFLLFSWTQNSSQSSPYYSKSLPAKFLGTEDLRKKERNVRR
ncbi:hypothetical protein E2C01_059814 [Portunus trituberculatus]|uniref:Uncharacterized protein n=1 Tax=Portunus trituberculatus TaxID=210409 RepID=A0A5B7H6V5_PORTR|nr:hypothetical protein [Portunus trituberculatus]